MVVANAAERLLAGRQSTATRLAFLLGPCFRPLPTRCRAPNGRGNAAVAPLKHGRHTLETAIRPPRRVTLITEAPLNRARLRSLWSRAWAFDVGLAGEPVGQTDLAHGGFVCHSTGANLTELTPSASECGDAGAAKEHGTHITSTILGQHEEPVEAIAPRGREYWRLHRAR